MGKHGSGYRAQGDSRASNSNLGQSPNGGVGGAQAATQRGKSGKNRPSRRALWGLGVTAFVVAPLVAVSTAYVANQQVEKFSQPDTVESPYRVVSAEVPASQKWLESFLSQPPFDAQSAHDSVGKTGEELPPWGATAANRVLLSEAEACAAPQPMPPYLLDYGTASNGEVAVTAATTQTGMSKKIITELEKRADLCSLDFERFDDNTVKIGSSTLLFYGDTIVSVVFNSANGQWSTVWPEETREIVENQVKDSLIASLNQSGCVATEVQEADSKRNIFYTLNNDPIGLFRTEKVSTQVKYDDLPTIKEPEQEVIDYPNQELPESPLPASLETDLPKKVEEPRLPQLPALRDDTYEKDITYEVTDTIGPGCGWGWGGLVSPVYDTKALKSNESAMRDKAQEEVNSSASAYINSYSEAMFARAEAQSQVTRWNQYANRVNEIHGAWRELISRREEIKPYYDNFLQEYARWDGFEQAQKAWQDSYDKKLKLCQEKEETHKKWSELDPKERDKYDEPLVCGDVSRPSILSQSRGDRPEFTVPSGVTIPNSWNKPGDNTRSYISEQQSMAENDYNSLVTLFETREKERKEEKERAARESATTTSVAPTTATPTTTPQPRNPISTGNADIDRVLGLR